MGEQPEPILEYAKPKPRGKYAGNAIFACAVAVLGVVLFPLPLLAFFVARAVLNNADQIELTTRRVASTARVISFFTTPISLLVLISFSLQGYQYSHPASNRIKCGSNMRQIGLALKLYANEFQDCYPPDLPTVLRTQDITADVFICPSTDDDVDRSTTQPSADAVIPGTAHCSYIYLPDPALRDSTVSPDRIMLIEPMSNHGGDGMNVLYGDGHVDFLDKIDAPRAMSQLLIGHNPPWPPTSQPAAAPHP